MDSEAAAFKEKMEMTARDPALKRAYDAYDKAESDWVTSMATAERRGFEKRQPEIDALNAEIAELKRRLGGR